jgi:hypothetical protein
VAAGRGASLAQPPARASNASAAHRRAIEDNGIEAFTERKANLGWVLLEVFAALAAAVAIVWWTFPKKPKDDRDRDGEGR